MDEVAAADPAHGQREVGRAASPPADRGGLDQVGAGSEVALDAGVEAVAVVVVAGDAAAVLGEQVQVGVGLVGRQADPDPSRLRDLEPVGVGVAAGPEARVAVLGRPATLRLQHTACRVAQRPEVGHLAVGGLLPQRGARPGQRQRGGDQGDDRPRRRQRSHGLEEKRAVHDRSLHSRPATRQANAMRTAQIRQYGGCGISLGTGRGPAGLAP